MCKQTLHLICSFMCTQLNHQCTMLQSLHVGSFWFKFNNYSRLQLFVNSTSDYNGDLNTGLVWYSKVIWMQEWIWSNFQITIWTGIQMGVCILEHHFYIKFVVECKMCVCTFAHPHEHGTNLPSSNQLSHRSDLHIPNAN